MWENSLLLTRYGKDQYHKSNGLFIDQIEALADSQRLIESYYAYADKYLAKVGDKIAGGKWRVVLKWSTKIGNACLEDEQKVLAKMKELKGIAENANASLANMQKTFDANAKKDYAKWDCEAMYPMPVQHKVNWIQAITDAVKEGFAIFN